MQTKPYVRTKTIGELQTADLNKLDASILIRRNHLKESTSTKEMDRLFVELEALEWLQRQVKRSKTL